MSNPTGSALVQWKEVSTEPQLSPQARQFVDEITAKREHGRRAGRELQSSTLRFLNAARECAVILTNARADLSGTQWRLVQGELGFEDKRQLQGLLEFGRKFPEPITKANLADAMRSVPDAQMALGLLALPDGHGPQKEREHNFALEITKHVTSVRAELQKQLARAPIATWTPAYASQVVAQLSPLLADLNRTVAEAKSRAAG